MTNLSDRDRWREIDALFAEAMDLDPGDWNGFLEERCGGDAELNRAVRRLLVADQSSDFRLEASAAALASEELSEAIRTRTEDSAEDRIGLRVGAFRILRQLGRGGMAGVYLAERADGEFEQRVAVKFLRRGLDTDDFVRRFRAERQILSSLEHPNIARLVDGGTTDDGQPYLALEYVDGVPITDFCDQHRSSLEERLRLFTQVARAVQYAHANLIVHRDIKPSNILVTAEGRVKLLDFGIAKLLDAELPAADAPLTRTGFRPLTPEYASPEQVRGETITTASDVYQLGLLLYRLLTGGRPYDVAGTGATLEDTVSNTRPRPPSRAALDGDGQAVSRPGRSAARLSRRLRGDLDTIVLKALRKEPARRYQTALDMAEDVEHHLAGRPITARRESRVYRAAKFMRRNPWVAPVSGAAIFVVAAYFLTLVQYSRRLEVERNVAMDVQQSFVSFFTAPDSAGRGLGEGRRDLTVRQAMLEGTERVRRDLADRPAARAELLAAMAAVLIDLDEPIEALQLAEEALELERSLYGEASPQVHETLLLVGELTPDRDSARVLLDRQLELSHELYGADHPATAASLYTLALVDQREGHHEDAGARLEESVRIYRGASSVHPRRLAWSLGRLADNYNALGRVDDALSASREAHQIMAREFGEGHSQTAIHGAKLAQTLAASGRYEEARPLYEASIASMDDELGPLHGITEATRSNYAVLLGNEGDLQRAESVQRELLEARRQRHGADHVTVAAALQNLAKTLMDQGRYAEAVTYSREAHEVFRQTQGPGHYQTALPLLTIAEIRLVQGDVEDAERVAREALGILRGALPEGHFVTAVAECRVGRALAAQGRTAEARAFLERAAEPLRTLERQERAADRDACLSALEAL